MKTIRYEVQTRCEDTGLWGTIRTVTVDEAGPDGKTRDWLSARGSAVAQAKGLKGQYSDLRVLAVLYFDRTGPSIPENVVREHYQTIWENGVWKDDIMAPVPVTV